IEFEMREGENYTVSLISSGLKKLSDEELYNIIFQCSMAKGVWQNIHTKSSGIEIISLRHTWTDHRSFSETVQKRLYAA
ncbi:hypothetical protein, partial [Aeromonas veronii]